MIERNELAHGNVVDTDEIRQIQMLMVLFSCLSPKSKLREVFEYALALPHEPSLSHISPVSDTSPGGLKAWLESLWVQGRLTPDEQKLVNWQRSSENMSAAIRELKAIEQMIGLKLDFVQTS
jgi:hypothetical protein